MGASYAIALADTVTDHDSLVRAVSIHLAANMYPPLPEAYIAPCVEAIEAINKDTYQAGDVVTLPAGINPVPRKADITDDGVLVGIPTLIDICHLYHFINSED